VRDPSQEHALRAYQLADPLTRRRLARSLRRVVVEADAPRGARLGSAMPVNRDHLRPCREALLGLAEHLEHPQAADPCGVARVLTLLSDGTGPLYHPAPERSLAETLWWVADGLQVRPQHDAGAVP
jgi:hypothetical protein